MILAPILGDEETAKFQLVEPLVVLLALNVRVKKKHNV